MLVLSITNTHVKSVLDYELNNTAEPLATINDNGNAYRIQVGFAVNKEMGKQHLCD